MHIEVFPGMNAYVTPNNVLVSDTWFWHFRNKGRITADSESFPTKAHAVRAAKSVVKAVLQIERLKVVPLFRQHMDGYTTIITWV
jgi:hypothetical protein